MGWMDGWLCLGLSGSGWSHSHPRKEKLDKGATHPSQQVHGAL